MNEIEENAVRDRITALTNEIEDELDRRNNNDNTEIGWKMSDARLAGYNAEIDKLNRILE